MPTASPPARRRPRPHPARRARKIAGALSIASMLGLTGCMVATTKSATTASTTNPSTGTAATASTATTTGSTTSKSVTAAAVAATPAAQSNTSTSGS